MDIQSLNGLEKLQFYINEPSATVNFSNDMTFAVKHIAYGNVVFEVTFAQVSHQFLMNVQEGQIATILNCVTGCVTQTVLVAQQSYLANEVSVKFCQSVPVGVQLLVEGKVVNLGKGRVITEAYLKDKDGELYAYANVTSSILRNKNE